MGNIVKLIGYYGGDKRHALSAWTSTLQDSNIQLPDEISERVDYLFNENAKVRKRDYRSLIMFLGKEGHHTPFEKSLLDFQILVDDATHVHHLKHRIGVAINGASHRYIEQMDDLFYIPEDWPEFMKEDLKNHSEYCNQKYHWAIEQLSPSLGRERAKDSARYYKTKNLQIVLDISFNFRSFAHFQKLRNAPNAQLEIRKTSDWMLNLVKEIPGNPFQYSLEAFGL